MKKGEGRGAMSVGGREMAGWEVLKKIGLHEFLRVRVPHTARSGTQYASPSTRGRDLLV